MHAYIFLTHPAFYSSLCLLALPPFLAVTIFSLLLSCHSFEAPGIKEDMQCLSIRVCLISLKPVISSSVSLLADARLLFFTDE